MPDSTRVRRRKLSPSTSAGCYVVSEDYSGYNPVSSGRIGPLSESGTQVTVSDGHDWPPAKGDPLDDRGGNFFTQKRYIAMPKVLPFAKLVYTQSTNPLIRVSYEGEMFPTIPGFFGSGGTLDPWPPDQSLNDSDLDQAGATAVARCKPGDPFVSLSTSLGELVKDGLPAIPGVTALKGKVSSLLGHSGGEYLNYQFGISPIVSDLKKILEVARDSDILLKQYERDAGRVVRRKYRFPIEESTSTSSIQQNTYPAWTGYMHSSDPVKQAMLGEVIRERRLWRRTWFSGAFTYTLPPNWNSKDRLSEFAAKANYLLGLDITPETLWNLAPWSWAIDWFSSAGDVISNSNSFLTNGLVMRYGYVMCHTITTDTYTHKYYGGSPVGRPYVPSVVLVTETKQRRGANPFGFGVSWDGLNPFQLSIAAALGISRK